MIGLGMMFLTLLRRKPSMIAGMLLIFAAFLMVFCAALNAYGDWLMMSGFRPLGCASRD